MTLSFLVVGNASLTGECSRMLHDAGHRLAAVVTSDPEVAATGRAAGAPVFPPAALQDGALAGIEADWLLSIANLEVLPEALLARARRGAINFHDGPLPRYAGLNAPVWARIAGEARHGVTWHRIEGRVDEGPILAEEAFPIDPEDTALTLNAKAWEAARRSFPRLLERLAAGDDSGRAQDLRQRSWFGRDRRPAAAGRIDFHRPADEIVALVRALDHGPYYNPLLTPKIVAGGRVLAVGGAEPLSAREAATPGTILGREGDTITVACAGGAVRLERLAPADGRPGLPPLTPGQVLASPGPAEAGTLDPAIRAAARHEADWRRRLAAMAPAAAQQVATGGAAEPREQVVLLPRPVAADEATALLALALAAGRDLDTLDLALLRPVPPGLEGYVAGWVPLHLDLDAPDLTPAQLAAAVAAARADLPAEGWLADLALRDPALGGLRRPGFALGGPDIAAGADAADGGVTLRLPGQPEDRLVLAHDAAQVPAQEVEGIAVLMRRIAAADPAQPLCLADLVTAADRDLLLGRWNDSAADIGTDETMHAGFERQAALTPDAVALVFEDQSLTYRALDARANRLAHALRGLGVGPDRPVGLYARRGLDLVAGALAILKAGGAYVPLDPAYPIERIAHYLGDSGASVILAEAELADSLPPHSGRVMTFDDPALAAQPEGPPPASAAGPNLAYLIYTSGSTGTPKGVMIEHRNVANFFAGMDARIPHAGGGTWLAVTSLSFDISVLELFWTLGRGFKVVITGDALKGTVSGGAAVPATGHGAGGMEFSLYYWGNDDGAGPRKYDLLLEGARFADAHGFCAVWTPERHFHAFGGPYPNPSVTGAAVAAVTRNIGVRSGSCVAPLHHPARIAEEWAVIDNLTNGRAGLGFASGWQPDDFVLRPENAPPRNKAAMFEAIDQVRRLWRGEAVAFPTASGDSFDVRTQPRPVSRELPVWVTVAGNPQTWVEAGRHGANVLTHLLGQSIDEVAQRITEYHAALREAGHDPARFTVTLMLHTFLAESRETAMEIARGPMRDYLQSAAGLVRQYAWAFPAFRKPAGLADPAAIDLTTLSEDELEGILEFAFQRYFNDSGLFGTVEDALARVARLREIGVTEVACLIDYGIPSATVLEGLRPLAEVLKQANRGVGPAQDDFSIAAQLRRHAVTHLQCTPTMAQLLVEDPEAAAALGGLEVMLLGGEALPPALLSALRRHTPARILNMYGPTETTIWSTVADLGKAGARVTLGEPIVNTRLHVLDAERRLLPPGVAGELWIGGDGVARGYWNRPELTDAAFRPDPFSSGPGDRIYRTGDLVRRTEEGALEFLGRVDQQVKIRGHRIELGEIEARLAREPGVAAAAVVARESAAGPMLVGFVTGAASLDPGSLRQALRQALPEVMVPASITVLTELPMTPNRKLDRRALARMEPPGRAAGTAATAGAARATVAAVRPIRPAGDGRSAAELEPQVATIWAEVLGLERVGPQESFFALGGHSLLALQLHRRLRSELNLPQLSITDLFRFPVLQNFVAHIAGAPAAGREAPSETAAAIAPEAAVAADRAGAMARRRALREASRGA